MCRSMVIVRPNRLGLNASSPCAQTPQPYPLRRTTCVQDTLGSKQWQQCSLLADRGQLQHGTTAAALQLPPGSCAHPAVVRDTRCVVTPHRSIPWFAVSLATAQQKEAWTRGRAVFHSVTDASAEFEPVFTTSPNLSAPSCFRVTPRHACAGGSRFGVQGSGFRVGSSEYQRTPGVCYIQAAMGCGQVPPTDTVSSACASAHTGPPLCRLGRVCQGSAAEPHLQCAHDGGLAAAVRAADEGDVAPTHQAGLTMSCTECSSTCAH